MPDFIFIYVTCASAKEAKKIAAALVMDNLAACANIFPRMVSVYKWENKMQESHETAMIIKTRKKHFKAVEACIKDLHSYETPCICALPVGMGSSDFLEWMAKHTA